MRTNIILRGHRNHQPIFSHPIHRTNPSRMGLRGILSRQPNPDSILRHSLPTTLPNCRDHPSPSDLPTRIRLKQPTRNRIRLRQNPIPPLLLPQRYPRAHPNNHPPNSTSPILTQPPRGPRKLHPRKPSSNPSTH